MSVIGYIAVSFTSYYVEIFATLSTALTGKIITGISGGKRSNRGWLYKASEEAETLFSAKEVEQCRREDLKLLETIFLSRTNDATSYAGIHFLSAYFCYRDEYFILHI